MTEWTTLLVASALVAAFYLWLVRGTDALEPEPPLTLVAAVAAGGFAFISTEAVDALVLPASLSAVIHAAVETGALVLAAAAIGRVSARLRGEPGSEIDGMLDGALYVGLAALGATLCASVRFGLAGGSLAVSLTLFQQALLLGLARVTLTLLAGAALGVAYEHTGALRRAAIALSGVLATVGLGALLGMLEPSLTQRPWWVIAAALIAALWFVGLAVMARRERRRLHRALEPELAQATLTRAELDALLSLQNTYFTGRRRALLGLARVLLRRSQGDTSRASLEAEARWRDELRG